MDNGLPCEYVAFDVETTGLNPAIDRVVEFGAVRFDASGRELGHFERLVNPGRPVSPGALYVHGLTDELLAQQPPATEILPLFAAFLGDPSSTILIAHNASFDRSFLAFELGRMGQPPLAHKVTDTLAVARRCLPHLRNHRLDTLARVLNLEMCGPHRALADSRRVKDLWLGLECDRDTRRPIETRAVDAESPPTGWNTIGEAIAQGWHICIEYEGGTRGNAPRYVTPRAFQNRDGIAYLIAHCHIDATEKQFRLDRVRRFEILRPGAAIASSPESVG